MKWWVVLALLWTALLDLSWSIPLDTTSMSSATETANVTGISTLQNDIPPEFILTVETFPDRMIYIPNLWFMLFKFMLCLTQPDFQGRASDYVQTGAGFTLTITREPLRPGSPFRLQNKHLVWAIQRLSEKLYSSRKYYEVDANLQLYGIIIGRLTLRYRALPIGDANLSNDVDPDPQHSLVAGNTTGDTMPSTELQTNNTIGYTTPTTELQMNRTSAMQLLSLSLTEPPTLLSRIDTLLTLIRATAQLAAKEYSALADDQWRYVDRGTQISLNFRRIQVGENYVKWSNVVSLLVKFVRDFQAVNKFYEAEGRLVKLDPEKMFQTFGIMLLTKAMPLNEKTEPQTS